MLYLRGGLPFCRRLCCGKRLLGSRQRQRQSVWMAVTVVCVVITMLEEKKAVSRKYLIIPSIWHYCRIVSLHRFYFKEFLLAGMLCTCWFCLWTLYDFKIITGVEWALNSNCYELLMIIFYQMSHYMLQMKFDKQEWATFETATTKHTPRRAFFGRRNHIVTFSITTNFNESRFY